MFKLLLIVAMLVIGAQTGLAAEEHGGWGALDLLGRILNAAVLLSLLAYVLRGPLSSYLRVRGEEIRRRLADAQRARAEAQNKLAEVEERMKRLDDELAEIRARAEHEARQDSERILAEAEREGEKIVAMARREIEGLMREARAELRAYTAELSISLAERAIKREINQDDQRRIVVRFLENITDGKK